MSVLSKDKGQWVGGWCRVSCTSFLGLESTSVFSKLLMLKGFDENGWADGAGWAGKGRLAAGLCSCLLRPPVTSLVHSSLSVGGWGTHTYLQKGERIDNSLRWRKHCGAISGMDGLDVSRVGKVGSILRS